MRGSVGGKTKQIGATTFQNASQASDGRFPGVSTGISGRFGGGDRGIKNI